MTVSTSTLADNSASTRGGGIDNSGGVATISGCTLSDNIADEDGGGLYNQGTVNLNDCTLDGNSAVEGGGLYSANIVFSDGTVLVASRGHQR